MASPNGFILASPASGGIGGIPRTVEKAIVAGYAANEGALLVDNGDGTYVECAADPAQVGAVALTPGGADTSGFNILGRKEFIQLTMQGIAVEGGVQFLAPFLGALPAFPGGVFGVTRDVDSFWKVDFNKIDKPVVAYLGNPVRSPADAAGAGQSFGVLVRFLDGAVQPI